MKSFKEFLNEVTKVREPHVSKTASQPSVQRAVRNKQEREREDLKAKQRSELEKAKDSDYAQARKDRDAKVKRSQDRERQKRSAKVEGSETEALEIGTKEMVLSYADAVPHSLKKEK